MDGYARFKAGNPFGSQAKLLVHLDRLHQYLTTGDTTPVFMEVNPTNRCNLRCQWCIAANSRNGASLDFEYLRQFFYDFAELGGKAITFSGGGEPTCYPHFEIAVLYAKHAGLDLGLMTNGTFTHKQGVLIGQHFDWVRFSVDTLNGSNYSRWKGTDLTKVVRRNVELLKDMRAKVGVNCNVGSELSVAEVVTLVEWVAGGAADYLQFRPVLPRRFKPDEKPQLNEAVWRYLDGQRGLSFLNLSDDKRGDIERGCAFPFRSCEGHFFEPILDATGEVKVCIYHPGDERLAFGNIHEASFHEIWASERRKQAIEYVRNLDYRANCQMCCKLTEPNRLLDFLTHPDEVPDKNFL
jgi:MoaA/NifB/PqqE/SkfB family radical SAM enzyme